jgi:hypothetical protein
MAQHTHNLAFPDGEIESVQHGHLAISSTQTFDL